MTDKVDILPYWDAIVVPTVADVHRRFGEYVERDDLLQEAAVWWYGKRAQKHLPEYLADDAHFVRLRRSIWRHCARYAQGEKAQKVGYMPEDQVQYTTSMIAQLLPIALDPDGLPDGGGVADLNAGIHAKKNLAEGGDVLASLVDVRRALSWMTAHDQELLRTADFHQHDWEHLGPLYGIAPDSVRRKHNRVVERMARLLNNEMPIESEEDAA